MWKARDTEICPDKCKADTLGGRRSRGEHEVQARFISVFESLIFFVRKIRTLLEDSF